MSFIAATSAPATPALPWEATSGPGSSTHPGAAIVTLTPRYDLWAPSPLSDPPASRDRLAAAARAARADAKAHAASVRAGAVFLSWHIAGWLLAVLRHGRCRLRQGVRRVLRRGESRQTPAPAAATRRGAPEAQDAAQGSATSAEGAGDRRGACGEAERPTHNAQPSTSSSPGGPGK